MAISRTAIKATVSVSPVCREGKTGTTYCNMGVMDEKDRPVACIAFGQIAVQLDGLEVGYRINLWGREKEGVFHVDGFEVPKVKRVEPAKNWRTAPPPRMEVDDLMDVLGPAYVEQKIRARFGSDVVKMLGKITRASWREFIDELKLEIAIIQETSSGEAASPPDKKEVQL